MLDRVMNNFIVTVAGVIQQRVPGFERSFQQIQFVQLLHIMSKRSKKNPNIYRFSGNLFQCPNFCARPCIEKLTLVNNCFWWLRNSQNQYLYYGIVMNQISTGIQSTYLETFISLFHFIYLLTKKFTKHPSADHCVKRVEMQNFFLVCIFPHSDRIRTRKNSVFGHFPRSKPSQPNKRLIRMVKENLKTFSFILYDNFIDFLLCSVLSN